MKSFYPLPLMAFLLLVFTLSLTSCSESEDPAPAPAPASKEELLTAKMWKISKITRDGINVTNQPDMMTLRSTRVRYFTNGTYTETTISSSVLGTWRLVDDILLLNAATADEQSWQIESLTASTMRLRTVVTFPDGSSDIFSLDLIHNE